EPSIILPSEDQDSVYGINAGIGIMRFTAGRLSFSPLRVGYQHFYGGDLDGLDGISGQAALRFHLGGGIQLRGDGGVLVGKMPAEDEEGQPFWSGGGGLGWGPPVIPHGVNRLRGGDGRHSPSADGPEGSEASLSRGYQLGGGTPPGQALIGTY